MAHPPAGPSPDPSPDGRRSLLKSAGVVSTMTIDVKAGMNRFQWNMRAPAPAGAAPPSSPERGDRAAAHMERGGPCGPP